MAQREFFAITESKIMVYISKDIVLYTKQDMRGSGFFVVIGKHLDNYIWNVPEEI